MLITSRLVRKPNAIPFSFPLQRSPDIFDLRLCRFRNHGARHAARPGPLRPLLLLHVYGRSDCGRLGDVGVAALAGDVLSPPRGIYAALK